MSKERTALSEPISTAPDAVGEERRDLILKAGLNMFMRYGFNRVTMNDIAHEAGISRPALYRDFRNKADIYSALAAQMLGEAVTAAEKALAGPGPIEERLNSAIKAGILDHIAEISRSPHGGEILDQKERLTIGIIAEWRDRMAAALSGAIKTEASGRGIDLAARGLSAEALGYAVLDGIEGAKQRLDDPAEWYAVASRQIRLAVLALGG